MHISELRLIKHCVEFRDKKYIKKIVVALGEIIRPTKEPCLSEMYD
jgi:hypothetical protein